MTTPLRELVATPSQPWRRIAACARPGVDANLFHPHDFDRAATNEARNICLSCPVARECLDDAIASKDRFGVRGGLTAIQRANMAQRQVEATR